MLFVTAFQGTFLMTQAAARQMIITKEAGGSIVNISSIVGKVNKFCIKVCP